MEKQFWVDFVEGRIDVPAMLAETEKRPELLDWLTGIADPKFKTVVVHKGTDEGGFPTYTPEELPFDAKMEIEEDIHKDPGGQLGKFLNIHSMFSRIMTTAFPTDGIVIDQTLGEKFNFMLDACPEYIGGPEVDHLLDALLEEIPADLSKTKRVKLYKEKVKALFPWRARNTPAGSRRPRGPFPPPASPCALWSRRRARITKPPCRPTSSSRMWIPANSGWWSSLHEKLACRITTAARQKCFLGK